MKKGLLIILLTLSISVLIGGCGRKSINSPKTTSEVQKTESSNSSGGYKDTDEAAQDLDESMKELDTTLNDIDDNEMNDVESLINNLG